MACRLYLGSTLAAPVSPAFSSDWEHTAGADRRLMRTAKSCYTGADKAVTRSGAINDDVLVRQYVSPQLQGAQTIAGTIKGILRAMEDVAGADLRAQMKVKVVSGDGATERGVLLAVNAGALASEFATTLTNRNFPLGGSTALSSVAALDGDRIVIEVGFRHHAAAGSVTGTLRFTDGYKKGTDLAENETGTVDNCSWIELSQTLTFKHERPTALPARMAETNISRATYYVDAVNGDDSRTSVQAQSRATPWKSLEKAKATVPQGTGAFIYLRTTGPHAYGDGVSSTMVQFGASTGADFGGGPGDPWTIATDPQDSGKALVKFRIYCGTKGRYLRFRNFECDGVNSGAPGSGTIDVQGGRDIEFDHVDSHDAPNGSGFHVAGDGASPGTLTKAENIQLWYCRAWQNGNDLVSPAHDHGIYYGTEGGSIGGCIVGCEAWDNSGFGIQFYENAEGCVVSHFTGDDSDFESGVVLSGELYAWTRNNVIVNSIFANYPRHGIDLYRGGGAPPLDGWANTAHHNCLFGNGQIALDTEFNTGANAGAICIFAGSDVFSDPRYFDLGANDFRLQESSPLRDAGDPAYTPSVDINGVPYVTSDIGAHALAPLGAPPPHVTFQNATETDWAVATRSPVVARPPLADGDLLLVFLVTNSTTPMAAPAGWSLIGPQNGGGDCSVGLLWKIVVSSAAEPASYTLTNVFGETEIGRAVVLRYTGADPEDPIESSATVSDTSGTTTSGPVLTPSEDNCMLLQLIGCDPAGAVSATPDPSPVAVERFDGHDASFNAWAFVQEYYQRFAGPLALDATESVSGNYGVITVALRSSPVVQETPPGIPDRPLFPDLTYEIAFTPDPAAGYMEFAAVIAGGEADKFIRVDLTSVSDYVIQAGDRLEWDIYVIATPTPNMGAGVGTAAVPVVSAETGGLFVGQWMHRSIQVGAGDPGGLVGQTLTRFLLICDEDVTGTFIARYRNLMITDGAGTVRKVIWAQGASLPTSAVSQESNAACDYTLSRGYELPDYTDLTERLLEASPARGRQGQLGRFEAGQMPVVVENRDRALDPLNTSSPYYPNIFSGRRSRLRIRHYWELLKAQAPMALWRLNATVMLQETPVAYDEQRLYDLAVTDSPTFDGISALVGESEGSALFGAADRLTEVPNGPASFGGRAAFSVSLIFKPTDLPNDGEFKSVIGTYYEDPAPQGWHLYTLFNQLIFVREGTGSTAVVSQPLTVDTVYHVVVTYDGFTQRLYIDGELVDSDISTNDVLTNGAFAIGSHVGTNRSVRGRLYAVAIWNRALSASEVETQQAKRAFAWSADIFTGFVEDWPIENEGRNPELALEVVDSFEQLANKNISGFRALERCDLRIGWVLDQAGFPGTREIDVGYALVEQSASATGTLLDNDPALEHLLDVADTELGAFFIGKSGQAKFQHRYRRNISFSVSQATYSDEPGVGELLAVKVEPSFSIAHVYNEIRIHPIAASAGTDGVASDADSQARYQPRTFSRTTWATSLSEAQSQAEALLIQTKEQQLRLVAIEIDPKRNRLGETPAQALTAHVPHILNREIGDRITVRYTPPGGGVTVVQESYIENISHEISARDGRWSWRTRFQLSPADATAYWILGVAGSSELGVSTVLGY